VVLEATVGVNVGFKPEEGAGLKKGTAVTDGLADDVDPGVGAEVTLT